MKKVITLLILFLLLPLSISAQAPGGHITRKKTSTTTSAPKKTTTTPKKTTPAPKETTTTPKKTTSAAKSHSSEKPRSATAGMSQAQKDRIIQNLINNMVYVEGGTFKMGATSEQGSDAYDDEKPAHQVKLSSFSIGRYEVTQEEWQAVMGSNPSDFKGAKRPVENVDWDDCQAFIRKLNSISGRRFRLPTEAEWEYAARGGNRSRGYKYAGSNNLSAVAWYGKNRGETHEVGGKQPNELGLYDMSGNVYEWCSDRYGSYSSSTLTYPTGSSSGSFRVYRGGCWGYLARNCRVSHRDGAAPDLRNRYRGFRLAQTNESSGTASAGRSTTTSEPTKTTATSKETTTEKPKSATAEMSQAQKDRIIQNLINNMVYVEGGTFMMGATSEQGSDAFDDEKPAHQVKLSSFSIGRYEVTQEEWQAVMGSNPSEFKGSKRPVENVSWDDCQAFIRKLNSISGRRFRLPTEAEWEYAARGGNRSRGYKYAGSNNLSAVAWYDDNSGTHEVGGKQPNELGLYDMSGNLEEWCQDWYGDYSSSSQTNPTGPSSGSYRVYRGGRWSFRAWYCRVSSRVLRTPDGRNNFLGFRLAQTNESSGTASAGRSTTTSEPTKTTATSKETTTEKPKSATGEMSQAQKDPIIQNLINNMVYVQGGTFTMGATSEQGSNVDDDEKPAHQVTLSSFSIGRYEVTQEEWQAVMGSNPSDFKGAKRPVENVSWDDCQAFVRKLNSISGRRFRLPTEAEWEYAARGGNRSRGYKYAGSNNRSAVAWYGDNSGRQTHEVGGKQPNELGLYDMSGNVYEWCSDWYGNYSSSSQTNPTGHSSGSFRVYRGGSWGSNAGYCLVSNRVNGAPGGRCSFLGFRLAQTNESSGTASAGRSTTSSEPTKTTATSKGTTTEKPKSAIGEMSQAQKDPIIQNLINNMVYVEGGTFMMGATSEQGSDVDDDEKPAHQVTLSSFSIGRYEVTQEEWQAVMGSNPSRFKGAKRPVEEVSWDDCQAFIRKLNSISGRRFRLPTEAEWEYAARGGKRSRGYKYAGSNNLSAVAWYDGYSGRQTHEVGGKQPNELGLYDMSGNVWEWCSDWYGNYSSSSQTNPTGPSSGSYRVDRGGSWRNVGYCRVSSRGRRTPDGRSNFLGFRLAQ